MALDSRRSDCEEMRKTGAIVRRKTKRWDERERVKEKTNKQTNKGDKTGSLLPSEREREKREREIRWMRCGEWSDRT
jgi:hypothetical protein